ncbi:MULTISPECIES: type II secretion system protein GspM [unclassified Janthinobacterium]|uniref:type II secretion system protein GspM n=1 Tax=unclassified Janthinobacterium TaxID=2610881 RepID=UPI001E595CB1|nr:MULTISPECIES: type II secretion system protein GspM [unclassified Janthinobacterium]MEC5158958.1 general secretion pathway protein M [Janthinobacterium sp. CG_S6]
MMNKLSTIFQRYRQGAGAFWQERTEQERKFLAVGGAAAALALAYALLIGPAVGGRARLLKEMPQLRVDAAEIEGLARQAAELARQAPAPPEPMSRAALTAALAARGLVAQSVSLTGDYAKLQLNGASFAALSGWLDALRRDSRVAVQEANVVALPTAGLVDATLTLRQVAGPVK